MPIDTFQAMSVTGQAIRPKVNKQKYIYKITQFVYIIEYPD